MDLPENFSFSQHNLQDYMDCRYRFLLKYVLGIEWPAVENEPVLLQETRMELGNQFHRLVQQYFAGIDPAVNESSNDSDELTAWGRAFTELNLNAQSGEKYAEKLLSIPLANHRLVAKYDLFIRKNDGSYTNYDWKTSLRPPSPMRLMDRLQSIVYPFVLQSYLSSAAQSSGKRDKIEMIYWFPAHPTDPVAFSYTAEQLGNDRDYLLGLVNEITGNNEEWFEKTLAVKKCAYCRYRSLCDRGISAGDLGDEVDSIDSDSAFELDFDTL